MQQTLTSLTEQAILSLEGKGWRFRAGERRLLIKRGEVDVDTTSLLRQIKAREACEYLMERAHYFIRQCRNEMKGV